MPDLHKPCLITGLTEAPVGVDDDTYPPGTLAFTCERCDQPFSEPFPTRMNISSTYCAFDPFAPKDKDRFDRGVKK